MKTITNSPQETKDLAATLAKNLKPGDILGLVGDLGGGKTCFVQGLAAGLQIPKEAPVSSPTFVLIQEYLGGRLPLYHFDFYRLQSEREAVELNLDEYFDGQGVCVVEWGDKFSKLFPKRTQWIRFQFIDGTTRSIVIASGAKQSRTKC
ncbi:MAG: tRNA (adenosine(37)-N6)-threonylcarbamoyltransferase complex ATPase subunit type 1 TsaE [Deltaproteobacteria bacterium]|nr:tRNA (adenosine(37)-N6)-threonylcarbamoyltransferase complex ATPase subunit type 1 TsaE [Deltaproteobacteria bacterium]